MSWIAPFLIVTAAILHSLSASFLSTIDEYRKIDSGKALKRHGRVHDQQQPQYGGDVNFGDDENPNCDVVMAQCQCEDNGRGGSPKGGGSWGGDGRSPAVPQVQKRHGGPGPRRPEESENGDENEEYVGDSQDSPDGQPDEQYEHGHGEDDDEGIHKRRAAPRKRIGNQQSGAPVNRNSNGKPHSQFYNTTSDAMYDEE